MALKHISWSRVMLHLLFWVMIVTWYAWGFGLDEDPEKAFTNALSFLPGHLLMVYVLLYYLIPKFLLQNKIWHFLLGLGVLVCICAIYARFSRLSLTTVMQRPGFSLSVGRNVLPFVHTGAIAASIKLLKYWYLQRKRTIEAEEQRTVAELKLLKAQLHPHFLFNTLNNLYSHTLEFSPKSPEIVLKLSALLRFMIYESNASSIPLAKEVELLKDYVSLEQLRYGDRLDMSISVSGEIERYKIAPLLLLPFLENAFKHGTSRQIDQCWINFNLSLKDNYMSFKLINSIDPNAGIDNIGHIGVGLDNVTRRLQLLYKDNYRFETVKMDEVFVVNLGLPLEKLEEQYVNKLQLTLK